jgi:EmrB/QacA subfamily drug resistance transporter
VATLEETPAPDPPAASAPGPDAPATPRQSHNVTLAVLAVAGLSYALAQTMIAPALPDVGRELHASPTATAWVLTAFLLSGSVATPVLGRFGDMFGKQRVLVWLLGLFAAGSLIAAVSHSLPLLILGRVVQGAAGAVFPLAFGIVRDEFPPEKTAQGLGLVSAVFGVGGGIGLVLSGLIVDHLAYEWIFWFTFVVALVALVLAWRCVPESPVRSAVTRIDYKGAALLSVGVTAILLAISQGRDRGWTSPEILGTGLFGFEVLLFWIGFELERDAPLVDMRMMSRRGVWTTNLTAIFAGFGLFGFFIMLPQFVETPASVGYGFGSSVATAGLYLMPATLMMLVAGPAAGAMAQRWSAKLPLIIGACSLTLGLAATALVHDTGPHVLIGSGLIGVGVGLTYAAMPALVVRAVDPTETGVATGMNTIMRTIGGSVGTQVAAALIAGHVSAAGVPEEAGYTAAFAVCAAVTVLGIGAALLVPGRAIPRAGGAPA